VSFTVNQKAGTSGNTASPVTLTISIPAGHTIGAVVIDFSNATIGTVSDSAGNTWHAGNNANDGSRSVGAFYSIATANAVTSVTYTNSGSSACLLFVWDLTATGTISYASSAGVIFSFSAPNTTDGCTTGNLAITSTDGLLLGYASSLFSNVLATGTGFTADVQGSNSTFSEHKAISASAPVTYTTPSSGDYVLIIGLALQNTSAAGNNASVAWWT
jgi:hypothetical protein